MTNSVQDKIRVINRDETPWWVAVDITKVLGYANTKDALTRHVDDEDRDTVVIHDSIGRERMVNVINESGLFSLMMGSRIIMRGNTPVVYPPGTGLPENPGVGG